MARKLIVMWADLTVSNCDYKWPRNEEQERFTPQCFYIFRFVCVVSQTTLRFWFAQKPRPILTREGDELGWTGAIPALLVLWQALTSFVGKWIWKAKVLCLVSWLQSMGHGWIERERGERWGSTCSLNSLEELFSISSL